MLEGRGVYGWNDAERGVKARGKAQGRREASSGTLASGGKEGRGRGDEADDAMKVCASSVLCFNRFVFAFGHPFPFLYCRCLAQNLPLSPTVPLSLHLSFVG